MFEARASPQAPKAWRPLGLDMLWLLGRPASAQTSRSFGTTSYPAVIKAFWHTKHIAGKVNINPVFHFAWFSKHSYEPPVKPAAVISVDKSAGFQTDVHRSQL